MADDSPVIDHLNIVVTDMAASVAFYRRLGVTIPESDPPWSSHHVNAVMPGLDFDLDSVEFAREWDSGWPGSAGVVVGFRVASRDDVDRLYADVVAAGHRGRQPPYDAFWGARYAVVEDPDGNGVGIMSPSDPGRRSMPQVPGHSAG